MTLDSRCPSRGRTRTRWASSNIAVNGTARLTTGGGPELLQRLAHTYLGPDVTFPEANDPPPGTIVHITIESIGGVGKWTDE